MENRIKHIPPAVKTVHFPDIYPSSVFSRSFGMPNETVRHTIIRATFLEGQYENLVIALTTDTPERYDNALRLVEVEGWLLEQYRSLAQGIHPTDPQKAQEQAETWLQHTDLLAKKRARNATKER